MAATAITTTPQNITGDFDLEVSGSPSESITLLKSLGSSTTNWVTLEVLSEIGHFFVKNTGTNSYKLSSTPSGKSISFNQ